MSAPSSSSTQPSPSESLETGDNFPAIALPDATGTVRDLDSLSGERGVVLFVYPKDDTPGCTTEAKDFESLRDSFDALGYAIVGVSKDSAASHERFAEKHSLGFPLLVDADKRLMEEIGAFGEKKLYGKVSRGVIRSTFVIERDGTLRQVFRNVRAKGHAARVLKAIS